MLASILELVSTQVITQLFCSQIHSILIFCTTRTFLNLLEKTRCQMQVHMTVIQLLMGAFNTAMLGLHTESDLFVVL